MHRIRLTSVPAIVLTMVITLAASAVFQISSYRNARRVEQISNRDAHVRDVLSALGALRAAVQDIIIERDASALDPHATDLQPYRDAASRTPQLIKQVLSLTANDPALAELARQLPSLIASAPGDKNTSPGDVPSPVTFPDLRAADEARRIIERMIDSEQQVRATCLAQTHAAASAQARSLLTASVYRVFVLIAGCTLILRQQARQRHTERMYRKSEAFFRNAFDHAATGMTLADERGRWIKVNRAICDLLGYNEAELLKIDRNSLIPPSDLANESAAAEELRAGRVDRNQLERRYLHKDGRTVLALVTTSLVRDEHGRPQTFISQIQDITERREAEERLRHQSLHDGLTGLPNRLFLDQRLGRAIERSKSDGAHRLAVLFLDLDRFKQINDSLGHAAGDKLLVTVAERLRRCVRGGDVVVTNAVDGTSSEHTVARLAGDEFTILLEGLRSSAQAAIVAERILAELRQPMELGGRPVAVGVSIGIVHADGGKYETAAQLLADADAALYKAKAAGRGRYAIFDADAQQSALDRLRMAGELRRAIEQEQFVLHYQPIVSLLDGQIAGFEALLRWSHPEQGLLAPQQFLDVAEETGLSVSLGQWAVLQAGLQLSEWRRRAQAAPTATSNRAATSERDELFMILSLSPKQLADPGLVERVREMQPQLSDGWLRVTIAEPILMQNADGSNARLAELRSAGVRVWVDNFGSGITSLGCIRSTALDGIKIDGRSVAAAAGHRDDAAVIHAVLELARNLRLQVVADGLETSEQVVMLQAMGCDLGQGACFGVPAAPGGADRFLDRCHTHARSA